MSTNRPVEPPEDDDPYLLLQRIAADVRMAALACFTVLAIVSYLAFGGGLTMARRYGVTLGPARVPPLMIANVGGVLAQQQQVAALGGDLMDVSSVAVMNALPTGLKGVWWGGGYDSTVPCDWSVPWATLSSTITTSLIGNPKFSGIIWISDEPHNATCPNAPADHAARTAAIHALDPTIKTYVVVLNADGTTEFQDFAAANAFDYVGVDPYPCNIPNPSNCLWANMEARITAAKTWWPVDRIIPVFQAFGQENTSINYYRTPTLSQFQELLSRWDADVPWQGRPFQMVYGWKNQDPVSGPTLVDYYSGNPGGWPNLQGALKAYHDAQAS